MLELAWGARTDRGLRRKRNEDAYLAEPPVFAVADGMGGHARGDLASTMAIEALREVCAALVAEDNTDPPRSLVLDQVREADRAITAAGATTSAQGMGTTVCGIVPALDRLPASVLAFNVGDSRVYRLREGALIQISHDHSVVQELVDDGHIDPIAAESHPDRNVVTRSLGSGDPLDIDWWTLDAAPGDRFLLCSDGLFKEVGPDQIEVLMSRPTTPQDCADHLVEAAIAGGGRDNITVVIVDLVGTLVDPTTCLVVDEELDTNPRVTAGPTKPRPVAATHGDLAVSAAGPAEDGHLLIEYVPASGEE